MGEDGARSERSARGERGAPGEPGTRGGGRPRGASAAGALDHLAGRFGLDAHQSQAMAALADLLSGDPLAPTAVHDPRAVLNDHIADSLVALELPQLRAAVRVVDLGSGAGLPGLALAIAQPRMEFTLLESNARKCAFIAEAIASCGATNARVVTARAESWRGGFDAFEVVTARAVAALDVVAEYAAPLLRLGGSLIAWRGRRDADAERAAERAAVLLGLEVAEPVRVEPYPGAHSRHLHVLTKVAPTPPRFPRRPGVALKRPLGCRALPPGTGAAEAQTRGGPPGSAADQAADRSHR